MEQLAVSSDVNPCGKSRAVGALNYIPIIVSLPTSFLYFGENTEQWHRKRTLSGEGGGGGGGGGLVSVSSQTLTEMLIALFHYDSANAEYIYRRVSTFL